jgi:hypothetical protein
VRKTFSPSTVKDDFLVAAQLGRTGVDDAARPAHAVGIAGVHAVEIAREQRGLVAAGARADFHDRVAAVVRIGRQQGDF